MHYHSPVTVVYAWQVENEAENGSSLWALVKGAPEVVQPFLADAPADYEQAYKRYASEGARCSPASSCCLPL